MKRSVIVGLVFLLGICAGDGKAGPEPTASGRDPFKLGLVCQLNGPLAQSGAKYFQEITSGIDKFNAAGGIGGHPMQLFGAVATGKLSDEFQQYRNMAFFTFDRSGQLTGWNDSRGYYECKDALVCDAYDLTTRKMKTTDCMETLAGKDVLAILSQVSKSEMAGIIDAAEKKRIPVVFFTTKPETVSLPDNHWVFVATPSDAVAAVAHALEQAGPNREGIRKTLASRLGRGQAYHSEESPQQLKKRGEQGDASAQTQLGMLYAKGAGVPRDDAEAAKWYRKSAEQGNAKVQGILGSLYFRGQGVPKDYLLAYMWLSLSASALTGEDRASAERYRDSVAGKMTRAQIAEATRLASDWKSGNTSKKKQKTTWASQIHSASQEGEIMTVQRLLQADPELVNSTDSDGSTPLHLAVYSGQEDVAKFLLAHGSNTDGTTNAGWTPLIVASGRGHNGLVQLLLSKGANVNAKDNNSWTALHWAIHKGQTAIAKTLLTSGADANARSKDGTTPLHLAAHRGYEELAVLLLAKGAEVNAPDENRDTPLHFAAGKGSREIVTRLLDNGADPNTKDNIDATPLDFAVTNRQDEIVTILRNVKRDYATRKTPGSGTTVTLAKLALKATVPAIHEIVDARVGDGIWIRIPGATINVEEATKSTPRTTKEAWKLNEMFSPKNARTEKLADGWAITFMNSAPKGTNYFVEVRREIGGKAYHCETVASGEEQQAEALGICKSLRR